MAEAKSKSAADTTTSAVSESAFPLTLEEFCTRLSASDRRVELIGGFHSQEKAAGRTKDTEAAFADRFGAFVNQPA